MMATPKSATPATFEKHAFTRHLFALARKAGIDRVVNVVQVVSHVEKGLCADISWDQVEELAAETAASLSAEQPEYADLAAHIAISAHHRRTSDSFGETMRALDEWAHPRSKARGRFSPRFMLAVERHQERIQATIDYGRDYYFSYFGFKTLLHSYLLGCGKADKKERPQHMLFRVLLALFPDDVDRVCEAYSMMSNLLATHATPTLFNAGTRHGKMASCYLQTVCDDSIEGIFETLKRCATLSKACGGIGLSVQRIRANQSYIGGSDGYSNGIVPMLRVFDATAAYVDQGSKRKGALAVYLEPWHADVFDFLQLRKNQGKEELRCRNLFTALWIPDLFMQRVHDDEHWSLFCPHEAKGLDGVYGEQFQELYTKYEREGELVRRRVPARELWLAIIDSQLETGTPYMLFKDSINRKSNHNHMGYISCSNLYLSLSCFFCLDFSSSSHALFLSALRVCVCVCFCHQMHRDHPVL